MDTNDLNAAEPDEILRLRLVQISDELGALPDDAFAEKHELNVEADEVRAALREYEGDQSEKLDEWAKRSARKGIPLSPEQQALLVKMKAIGDAGGGN